MQLTMVLRSWNASRTWFWLVQSSKYTRNSICNNIHKAKNGKTWKSLNLLFACRLRCMCCIKRNTSAARNTKFICLESDKRFAVCFLPYHKFVFTSSSPNARCRTNWMWTHSMLMSIVDSIRNSHRKLTTQSTAEQMDALEQCKLKSNWKPYHIRRLVWLFWHIWSIYRDMMWFYAFDSRK